MNILANWMKKGRRKMAKNSNYSVELISTYGSCEKAMFQKQAQRGDITSQKIEEFINEVVTIKGYAKAKITTKEKEFTLNYFVTDKGIISTGSEVFMDSVEDYIDDTNVFKILKVKTTKGHTYKAQPQDIDESEEVE